MTSEPFKTFFDPSTCVRKGLCPVTKIREQAESLESHSLYFEQHGTGPTKVVFIMGLNNSSFAWRPQVDYFGRLPEYSVLVFDNRGVGNSGTPRGPYTTSGMAEDVVVLLNYVGWTNERDLHVVGLSLGGMIAQELSTRIPERIVSLSLIVTTPGGKPWSNFPPWKGAYTLIRLIFIKAPEVKIPIILDNVHPRKWLEAKAADDPKGRTNFQVQSESLARRVAVTRLQTPLGSISQMYAGLTHNVTPDRLCTISRTIPKVMILTGDEDNLVDPKNSFALKRSMKEAELLQWKGMGHGITVQAADMFHELLKKTFEEGKANMQY